MSKEVVITSGGRERVSATSLLYASAFSSDPVITYMLYSLAPKSRTAYLPAYFRVMLDAAAMNHAIFVEADDFKNCSVLMPPGSRVDNPFTILQAGFIPMMWKIGVGGCRRMLMEFQPLSDASKQKGLKGQKNYYYIFFTGTRGDARGLGLCSTVMREFQERASRENVPLWLEATTEKSRGIYERLRFETIDEMVLGKGKVSADGNECVEGEGVKIWSMVWWPEVGETRN